MADKNIGLLPQASTLTDDSLFICEDSGAAKKVTGKQFKDFAKEGASPAVKAAESAADRAEAAIVNAPKIQNGTWWTFDQDTQVYVNTGVGARGPQGIQGKKGEQGPQGPKGDTGTGLTIIDRYESLDALKTAVPSPAVGSNYYVGAEAPYDVYTYTESGWVNNGPLQGPAGPGVNEITATLTAGGWSNGSQTFQSAALVASGYGYIVTPAPDSYGAYAASMVYADAVTVDGEITFHCEDAPTDALTASIMKIKVEV